MAITRENIAHFYEKYKENLKTEESVIEQFTKADTKENWVANLKKKYRSMRQLYIENEALLNLYIRPFTEGRMELNDELADEFLKQIRDASAQGYEDNLSMLELAEDICTLASSEGLDAHRNAIERRMADENKR